MQTNHILKTLSVILILYGAIWSFNHLNPWLGIIIAIALILIINHFIFKKHEKSN